MVGHPGETGEDFQELLDFVRKTRFERLGAFPYSHEEDTYNDKHYKDDVPAEVKQERMERLMELQEGIALSVNEAKVGNTLKVIIDREDPEYYVGRTEYDSPEVDGEVLVGKRQALTIGDFYQVKIESALPFDLFGSVLE